MDPNETAAPEKPRWNVVGVLPVTGQGLLFCQAKVPDGGPVEYRFGDVEIGGDRNFAKRLRKLQKDGPVLLCWDAPLTSAEFQKREIERTARGWVRGCFPNTESRPIVRSAGMRSHWIVTQRLLGLPIHEGMTIKGSMLQPKLICEDDPPDTGNRKLCVTEVHAALAMGLHPAGRSIPWYRDNLENAMNAFQQLGTMWKLTEEELELPKPIRRFRMHDFVEAWVAMALGIRWFRRDGVHLVGDRKRGSFLLPMR